MAHQPTRRAVTVYHDDTELTVEVSDWMRDEFDIEWSAESQAIVDSLDREQVRRLEQAAKEAWCDAVAGCDAE